jgi:hypothetical protein
MVVTVERSETVVVMMDTIYIIYILYILYGQVTSKPAGRRDCGN